MRKLLLSPLFFFLLLGFIFFALYELLFPEKEEITISQQSIEALIQQSQELNPTPLTEQEKQDIIEGFIDDEVLIREARKQGLDLTDTRVRKRLLQVMRSSLSETVADPTTNELIQFFEEEKERYRRDSARSFVHVYFELSRSEIPSLSDSLISLYNEATNLSKFGDTFISGNRFPEYSYRQTAQIFGGDFAKAVFNSELNQWFGPETSNYGKHFIYVFEEHPPKYPELEEVKRYLEQDYVLQKARESQQKKIDKMKEKYKIIVE